MALGVTVAGELQINKMFLVPGDAKSKIDITGMFLEIDLFEDIFSHTMSGTVTMVETFNLIMGAPIVGEEALELEWQTPGLDVLNKTFFVYKISRHSTDMNTKHVYVLHIISNEALVDMSMKLSRSFQGMPNTIITGLLNNDIGTDKKFELDTSANIVQFVAPYWSPFKCINYAATRCRSTDAFGTPTYLFYETTHKYKLKSLNTLYQQAPITQYYYDKDDLRMKNAKGESTIDIDRAYKTCSDMIIVTQMDYIDRIMNGVYSFKVFDANILNKTVTKRVYNMWNDFEKTKHLESHPINSENVYFDDENGRIEWAVTQPFIYDAIKQDYNAEILSKRLPLLAQTELFTVKVTVPGRTDMEVGQTVIFNMGDYSTRDDTDKTKAPTDKYYSGKYLITAIQHRMTRTRHRMIATLMKDSVVNAVSSDKVI